MSFFDFKAELDRRQSGLWMSGPSHSWGSVIGNALEHGVGYTPYGVHAETICGMEVMLADGTLVRTGFGGVEGSQEWQCYKWPFGPAWDGLFTQSNFAVVTKMGVWLMPEPHEVASVSIDVPARSRVEQVYAVIERRFIEFGIDPWLGSFGIGARALIFVADMLYKRDDAEMTDRCRRLFRQLCGDMEEMGVGLYRSHLTFMDDAAEMYGWGNHAMQALNNRLKGLLDPNGILAPGKQGIGSAST